VSTVLFHAQFTASKAGKTGLTPTIDVHSVKRSDGTIASVVSGGSMTEVTSGRGCYFYALANADLQTYDYIAVAVTADATVDQKEIPALWSRFSEAVATNAAGAVTLGGYAAGQDPATLVLDTAAAGHNTAGTIGAKINAAGAAADPLATVVPGSYAPGTAGWNIGHMTFDAAGVLQADVVRWVGVPIQSPVPAVNGTPGASPQLAIPTIPKEANRDRLYVFDFSKEPEVIAGDTLATSRAGDAGVYPLIPAVGGLTIAAPVITATVLDGVPVGKGVSATISGGLAGVVYLVECRCVTAGGARLVKRMKLSVE
jgi:hypothetical protein